MITNLSIICSTDHNFVAYTGIMLTSLYKHNPGVDVYVLIDEQFCDKDKKSLLRLSRYFHSFQFVCVKLVMLRNFPIFETISLATYYKIFSTEILPVNLHKVLYLDSDMLIRGSLQELWNTDINDYALAGVCDLYDNANETYQRLEYTKESHYINAGMLLINLDWWREYCVYEKCLDYIRQNHKCILWCEQDVLNKVLSNHKKVLPIKYNYQVQMLMKCHYETLSEKQQRELLQEVDPLIIHYVGQPKPWNMDYYSCPFYNEWNYYKQKSPWKFMLPVLSKKNKVKTIIKRYILWPLGWKRSLLCEYIQIPQ